MPLHKVFTFLMMYCISRTLKLSPSKNGRKSAHMIKGLCLKSDMTQIIFSCFGMWRYQNLRPWLNNNTLLDKYSSSNHTTVKSFIQNKEISTTFAFKTLKSVCCTSSNEYEQRAKQRGFASLTQSQINVS